MHNRAVFHALQEIDHLFATGYRKNCSEINSVIGEMIAFDEFLYFFFQSLIQGDSSPEMAGAQSYLVFLGKFFYARLNFWLPERAGLLISPQVDRYFSIGVLHNHSFDFFTAGLLGPGYRSTFFCVLDDIERYRIGDTLPLALDRRFQLNVGMALFVPKSTIFHVQHYPESLSISLNFIPRKMDEIGALDNRQLLLDEKTHNIEHILYHPGIERG